KEISKDIEKTFGTECEYAKKELLPVKSVGVQGDNRTYAHPLVVWGETDWEKLHAISLKATNNIRGINRVVLLLNENKSEKFILPEKSLYLTKERVDLIRKIDDIVNKEVKNSGIYEKIWQFPVVLLPLTDRSGKESVVLRPINSRDAMTLNFYRMKKEILDKIVQEISATGKISHIFFDITDKPPGTTEWE
ncbi:MAG TPA: glutamine-hydrolyzing GMP synthase, partial [Patescibacteria group bacterium]|nr:glutamine-hydrolyzing GMP synthase [Patescibacteria group bacterium]